MIWGLYMDALEDEPELLVHEPSDFVGTRNLTTPTVYTGFPALLHVNSEARSIAQKRLNFAHCPSARCVIPIRPFNTDLDVLYIPWEAWRSFFLLREMHYSEAWLSKVQHVAVDICLATNLEAFFKQVPYIPSIRTLRFLLSSESGSFNPNSMLILPSPIPRCTLRKTSASGSVGGNVGEASDPGRVTGPLASYLKGVISSAQDAAERATRSGSNTERLFLERYTRPSVRLQMEINVFTEFRYSSDRASFVGLGEDNVAELVLPVT
ncbi:hypothetical protein F5Y08DRAFT_318870 [Xylaria arbuscula]|nr:hypothetical protein F5Y08DRAFT_318870 [Xylaria arbuscula]